LIRTIILNDQRTMLILLIDTMTCRPGMTRYIYQRLPGQWRKSFMPHPGAMNDLVFKLL
jgi:hypothetical protein